MKTGFVSVKTKKGRMILTETALARGQEWRLPLSVKCPVCGANKNERCTGKIKTLHHEERVVAYSAIIVSELLPSTNNAF